nr:type I-U CRISPR-associated protein Csb2 [Azospirillum oleiclasticum]
MPTAALWRLEGAGLPPVERGYPLAALAKRAALHHAARLTGPDAVPAVLHGHDGTRDPRQPNAFFLPADEDGDGRIDHVLIHAAGGLDRAAVAALAACERLFDGRQGEWPVRCVWLGMADAAPCRLAGRAAVWVSATPWFSPLHPKRGLGPEALLARDLAFRGRPAPARLERLAATPVTPGSNLPPHAFATRLESRVTRPRPDPTGSLWRVAFPEPVQGPLALGWDCHLGLGLFRPEEG